MDDADQGPHRHAYHRRAHPVGIKVFGANLTEIQRIGEQLEGIMRDIPGTRSVYAERVTGGYFVDFNPRRDQLARYGLTIDQVQTVIMTAIGWRERHQPPSRGASATRSTYATRGSCATT